ALGGGAALRGRSAAQRHRRRHRLLGRGGAAFASRGTLEVEKGGASMSKQPTPSNRAATVAALERARATSDLAAAAAARRLAERAAAEGLADVSFTAAESPFGSLLVAATKRG